jgi:hypothetical protein
VHTYRERARERERERERERDLQELSVASTEEMRLFVPHFHYHGQLFERES